MSDTTWWRETWQRLKLAWQIVSERDDNLVRYVRNESTLADPDMADHLVNVARVFSLEGHSGCSAPYAVAAIRKLLAFQPLLPLTGDESEWVEVGHGMWQNRRCSRVFKETSGQAYDIEGRVFRDRDGLTFTSRESRVHVTFPYTPTTTVVNVAEAA